MQMPMGMLGLVLDADLRRPEAFAFYFIANELARGELELFDSDPEPAEINAGIDQSAESHIAADAAQAIEIRNLHAGPPVVLSNSA